MMSDILLNCLITLIFIASVKAIIFKPVDTLLDTVTVEHLSSKYEGRHRRSTERSLPMEMHFRFSSKGSDVHLRLKRSLTNQASDIPVYVIRKDKIVQENLPPIQNAASYLDKGMGASILVRRRIDGNFTLEGTFYDSGGRLHIHPADGPTHEISRAAEVNYGDDFIVSSETTDRQSAGVAPLRTKRQSVNEYTIGILMCADYKDYSHWENHFKNQTLVKSGMRQYYAIVAQSMSLRYASVTDVDPRLKINIHITGLLIVDNPGKSYWTENEATGEGTVEVKPALRSFKEWVRSETSLPPSDHWMLFSGYDLTSNGSKLVAGLATLAAMCTSSSVSIIEQDFSASVGATAAHELGHCLSAFHDGSVFARSCPDSDNYIMSSKLVNPTENATASRPWEFSRCSVQAFRTYLARVYCARKPKNSMSAFNTPEVTNLKPGQVYSSDIQCKLSLGNESYFGRGIQYDRSFDSMCRAMYCAIPGRPRFFQKMFAMEKTTCGDGKWCIKGRCVSDPEAPRTPEFCPQGDDPSEHCKLNDCPFLTKKGKISYCCKTCGTTPKVVLHTLPADPPPTTTITPLTQNENTSAGDVSSRDHKTPSVQSNDMSTAVNTPVNTPVNTTVITPVTTPDSTKSKPITTEKARPSVIRNVGPGVFAIMQGMFSGFGNILGENGETDTGRNGTPVTAPNTDNTSSDTPTVGSWLSRILSTANPGFGPTNVKFISVGPRPLSSDGGTEGSIFNNRNGFSWSVSDTSSPSSGRGIFVNTRKSVNNIPRDSQSVSNWIGTARPLPSSATGSVRIVTRNNRRLDQSPPSIVPRFTTRSRVTPRWRVVKPVQKATSSESPGSGMTTITISDTGNGRAFCVSCSPSWTSNGRSRSTPLLIQTASNRPKIDKGVSWLRRSAMRSVSGTNVNDDSFRRILTIPRIVQG